MAVESNRRGLLAAAGVSLALALPGAVQAKDLSAAESRNAEIIRAFIGEWTKPAYDPEKVYPKFMTSDVRIRMDPPNRPALVGPATAAAEAKAYLKTEGDYVTHIDDLYVRGNVVVVGRTDTQKAPGKPDKAYRMTAVFVLNNGKILEWNDYYADYYP